MGCVFCVDAGPDFDWCRCCGRGEPDPAGALGDVWHRPVPGPLYWDWRCRVCGHPVDVHPGLLDRLRRRWRERRR